MNILSIESSCDETACAIVRDGHDILSNVVVSQIDIFKAYGGVIPEVAARSHLEAILPVVHKALDDAFPKKSESEQWDNIDAISVTHTPGLLGSLLIGTLTARTLAILHNKPFYPIHHLKSHIYSAWLLPGTTESSFAGGAEPGKASISTDKSVATDLSDAPQKRTIPQFPVIALVISGGHTQIIRMTRHNDFEIIGTTRDDAVGECFDKVAKILGLPYPGGPSISNAALGHISLQTGQTFEASPGDRHRYQFPHPKVPGLDFSFSGLKTAVLRELQSTLNVPISFPSHDLPGKILEQKDPARLIADFSASFEQTAISILLEKLSLALQKHPDTKSIVIAGGVSANSLLRRQSAKAFSDKNIFKVFSGDFPPARNEMYIPDDTDRFARRAVLPAVQRMISSSETGSKENTLKIFFPAKSFSGDNAAMVASATYYEIKTGVPPSDPYSLTLLPRSPIS